MTEDRWKLIVLWEDRATGYQYAHTEWANTPEAADKRGLVLAGHAPGSRPYGNDVEPGTLSVRIVRETKRTRELSDGTSREEWYRSSEWGEKILTPEIGPELLDKKKDGNNDQ